MDFETFEHLNFRLPGPTPLPPSVRSALSGPAIHHRGPLLKSLMARLTERLQLIHRTQHPVLIWPGSGSAGWEIAITNLLSPGDAVIVTTCGDFGDRFAAVAKRFGLEVHRLDKPWGQAVLPSDLEAKLQEVPHCKAVLITHNETSTGVTNPLAELAAVAHASGRLVIVDAVSSAGALPLKMDEWDLDFVSSGSQKAWMCPPGLVICAIGPRAWAAYEQSGYYRFFWDIKDARAMSEKNMTVATPPLNLLFGLDAALQLMVDEGLDEVWARHQRLGDLARHRVREAGLELFADPAHASDSLTALRVPDGSTASGLVAQIVAEHNVLLQIGQGALAEKVIRIGHMGWVTDEDVEEACAALAAVTSNLALA
ncbi:MAG TPA: alanine--glyoxylate aminotransferase family protein [Thermomicrobiales bacterium]|nr:alanine--glyoxylate aminotransferase family protein [Thermomicrobiales bacterium]